MVRRQSIIGGVSLLSCLARRTRAARRSRHALLAAASMLGALALGAAPSRADGISILDYAPTGTKVDRSGTADAAPALTAAINAANALTAQGKPACVYIPTGTYRIKSNPPQFARAGCIKGDGPTQSTLLLDKDFSGDLFTWSEAWGPTTPGPTVVGLRIVGDRTAGHQQNALVFYDRDDEVFLDQIVVSHVPGRALYSGISKRSSRAYMRESHLRSLRFFDDGAPGVPVVEFSSTGQAPTDATNEIRLSQVDIYGARGPGFVIRNAGDGFVRAITADSLRIEGPESGQAIGDLLTIGDPHLGGTVSDISFTNLELIDVPKGFAAFRLTAPEHGKVPYLVSVSGMISGGASQGEGLRIDAGRTSNFHFHEIATSGTNVIVSSRASQILLDGSGVESCWTYDIAPAAESQVMIPARLTLKSVLRTSGTKSFEPVVPRC